MSDNRSNSQATDESRKSSMSNPNRSKSSKEDITNSPQKPVKVLTTARPCKSFFYDPLLHIHKHTNVCVYLQTGQIYKYSKHIVEYIFITYTYLFNLKL